MSSESGHYVLFMRSGKKWYKFNDEIIEEIRKESIVSDFWVLKYIWDNEEQIEILEGIINKIIEKDITVRDLANYSSLKYVNAMMLWEESPEIAISKIVYSY